MSEWKMAPKAATWEMLDAALPHVMRESDEGDKSRARGLAIMVWDAMLSAAPQPEQKPGVWMQSDHLHALMNKHCGAESMLARCSDHQLMADYKPLYTGPQPTEQEGERIAAYLNAQAAHVEDNANRLREFFRDDDEARCRELAACYLRELASTVILSTTKPTDSGGGA